MYTPLSGRSSGAGPKNVGLLGFSDPKDLTYFLRPVVEDQRLASGDIRTLTKNHVAERGLREYIGELSVHSQPHIRRVLVGGDPVYDDTANQVRYQVKIAKGRNGSHSSSVIQGVTPLPSLPAAHMAYYALLDILGFLSIPGNVERPEILDTGQGYFVIATVTPDSQADLRVVDDKLAEVVRQLSVNGIH